MYSQETKEEEQQTNVDVQEHHEASEKEKETVEELHK